MNAREYLEQIKMLDELINNKLVEVCQLRCLATSCTAPTDREPGGSSGVSDRVGNIVAKIVDIQAETDEAIDRFIDLKRECISIIESVRPPIYYTILHKYHIQYMSLVDISEEIGYEYHYTCDLHRKAIAEVQKVLDERSREADFPEKYTLNRIE